MRTESKKESKKVRSLVVEEFGSRFTPGGRLLYLGDA